MHDGRGDQAVDRAAGGQRSRRSVDETSRRGIATRSTLQPPPGGSACASPRRSTTTIVASSRVSSSRRHVDMLATASAPSTRNSSRCGLASASRVSAVTDAASRSTSIDDASTPSTPSTAASTSMRRSRAEATTLPRFCHGSPATTSSTRSRSRTAACLDRDDDVRRRAPDRTCRRTPPAAPHGECTGASCLHPSETLASSSAVPSLG